MTLVMSLIALVPAIFGGWFFGSSLAMALDLGKTSELTATLIFGGLLWLTLMFA